MLGVSSSSWVFIMKSDDERSWSANLGYDDSIGIYYSYDSNVANCKRVQAGHLAVIRSDDYIAGWGIIEGIEVSPDQLKEISRCPKCAKTNHYARRTLTPRNRCSSCKHEFEDGDAVRSMETVTTYRAFYANTWTEAARPARPRDLTPYCQTNDTFNAIRPLDSGALPTFLSNISGRDVELKVDFAYPQFETIVGGFTTGSVRRRKGQREFRFQLIDRFGESCAISGSQPPQVLEAAHLYSFAAEPVHKRDGGLLLRRDFHALFDANLITVNPSTWHIEVAPRLEIFPSYREISGRKLLLLEQDRPSTDLISAHYERARQVFSHN